MKLSELAGKKVMDIDGYVTSEFGHDILVFKISKVVFEDGSTVWAEGEHDIAYLPGEDFDKQALEKAYKEEE